MTEIAREKFARLIAHIEDLEARVEELEKQLQTDNGALEPRDALVCKQELKDLTEQLARSRSELSRISDGCGRPHPM